MLCDVHFNVVVNSNDINLVLLMKTMRTYIAFDFIVLPINSKGNVCIYNFIAPYYLIFIAY